MKMLHKLDRVTELNNQFHSHGPAVMFSVGTAICDAGGAGWKPRSSAPTWRCTATSAHSTRRCSKISRHENL